MTVPADTRRRDVRYGDHAITQLPAVAAGMGARRILLVCGARSFEASGAARVLPELERVAEVRRWSGFAPNTDTADLLRGLALAEEVRPDLVLGVGGGSAMDMGKLLCAFAGTTDQPALHKAIRSGAPVERRELGLVLAPTTSGSGSEATHFAVAYIDDEKYSVTGVQLRPDVVLLDPALTHSGSAYQRATSGIDAVAQAIESMWAVAATAGSRRWARHALGLLLPAIETYVNRPTDAAARAMAIGSHLAGRAIDISKTTAPHALSYSITKRYGVSHGHAVALTLGAFIEAHAAAPAAALQPGVDPATHRQAIAEVLGQLGATTGEGGRDRFGTLLEGLGLPHRLSQVGPRTPAERRELVTAVNVERLGNNPVRFAEHDLEVLMGQVA